MRDAHARYIDALTRRDRTRSSKAPGSARPPRRLDLERGNLRTAMRHLVDVGDADLATDIAWRLYLYWWLRGFFYEVGLWMKELLERVPEASAPCAGGRTVLLPVVDDVDDRQGRRGGRRDSRSPPICSLTPATSSARRWRTRRRASRRSRSVSRTTTSSRCSRPAPRTFRRQGRRWAETLALVALGRVSLAQGRMDEAIAPVRGSARGRRRGGRRPLHADGHPSSPRPSAAARGRDGCRGPRLRSTPCASRWPSSTTRASPTRSRACAPSPRCAVTSRSPPPWRAPPR